MNKFRHILSISLITALTFLLSGCQFAMLNPKGIIATSEMHLLIDVTLLMLIIVIPVIILTFVIAWRYRASNKNAKYTPDHAHNTVVEIVCWSIPGIIILILSTITWISTHKLDPYKPLDTKSKPLIIQVVSLDWRWLFIYPKQHIATINYINIPVNQQVKFVITADSPMNSIEMPQLAGQIYAMPGMQTKLHFMANEIGHYRGFAANYTGDGFANMVFWVRADDKQEFNKWVKDKQHSPHKLTMAAYNELSKPSKNSKRQYFSLPEDNLFNKIIMKYKKPAPHLTMTSHNIKVTDR
ncbi:MAG: ubiquinol oxidase subunit II [Psychromonas sp.]|nr:ubiquinol oxidase subunit II [Psychromonas sp.]